MGNLWRGERGETIEVVGYRWLERCGTDRRADSCLRFWWDLITAVWLIMSCFFLANPM